MRNFTDNTAPMYVELPVPVAWAQWRRGDAKLAAIAKQDPGAYLGGWSAWVTHHDKNTDTDIENPKLPLPVVKRTSNDGKHPFQVYASNILSVFVIQSRMRYELRDEVTDPQTGKKKNKVVAISLEKLPHYQPRYQIFGLVFDKKTDDTYPVCLNLDNWSAFISYTNAGQLWSKIKPPADSILVRRYGTLGIKDSEGNTTPELVEYNKGLSTPIKAIGVEKPRIVKALPEWDELFDASLEWKNCPRWNASGKANENADGSDDVNPDLLKFDQLADEAGLSNIDKAQLVAEYNGDYKKAIESLSYGGEEPPALSAEDLNARLAEGDSSDEAY
jgi:hypothetical protein